MFYQISKAKQEIKKVIDLFMTVPIYIYFIEMGTVGVI